MTLETFAQLVTDMRHLQREYFKRKDAGILEVCKVAERSVDKALEEMRAPTLFDQPERTA